MKDGLPIGANLTEPKRVFLARAMLLGAIAGCLETLLVLGTGIMPPFEVAFNLVLLVGAFGAAAAVSIPIRRIGPLKLISGGAVLILVSVLTFALRGCLHECGEDWKSRVAVPAGIAVLALFLLAATRRFRPDWFRRDVILISTGAMTMAAIDFARRDGLAGSPETFVFVALLMAVLGALSALLARQPWIVKLGGTLSLAVAAIAWSAYLVRPPRIKPVVNASNPLDASDPTHQSRAPNLVLIILDTVRADHMSLYGYARKTTPNLDALAAESLVFDRAIASGNYSLPSHASLLTGKLPSEHGAHLRFGDGSFSATFRRSDSGMAPEVETLASRLRASGFTTGGVSGNYAYLASWTGLQRGFDAFDDRPKTLLGYHPFSFPFLRRLNLPVRQFLERSEWEGDLVASAGVGFATRTREPFFLFLNIFDAHNPFVPRPGHIFRGDGRGSDVRPIPAYDSEIAYVDDVVGSVVTRLRKSSLLDRTILVVAADHGEFFGEHGLTFHRAGAYEEVLHVPLLVRYPKALSPGRVSRPFGLHEAHRLMLDLVESRPTDWVFADPDRPRVLSQIWGRVSSADTIAGARAIGAEANVIYMGSLKLIDRMFGVDEMYDLAADPKESLNLLTHPSEETLAQRARMAVAVKALPPAVQGTDPEATALDIAALRGLGYISVRKPDRR